MKRLLLLFFVCFAESIKTACASCPEVPYMSSYDKEKVKKNFDTPKNANTIQKCRF